MKLFRAGMNEKYYFQCDSCGQEMHSTNEDDHVVGLCDMCGEYGSDCETDRGYPESDYCNHEDYPCCGCS